MRTFITSDMHFGESRFDIMQRPFSSVEEYNSTVVTNYNSMIGPEDEVYVLGDAICAAAPTYITQLERLNGHKILVRGNHDRGFADSELKPFFERIVAEGDGIELQIGDLSCWLTHYPTCGRVDRFNIVGHIHAAWKFQLNMLNVCVDVHHFNPVPIDRVPFFFKAICEFYDNDVWCAYAEINKQHCATRGKKSSYFGGANGKI